MAIINKSIGEIISDRALDHSHREALVHTETGCRYTYRRLSREIDRAAKGFLNLGIQPGDKIALWSPNNPEWMVVFIGLVKIGAIFVPIDPAATKDNLYYILKHSGCRGFIIGDPVPFAKLGVTGSSTKSDISFLNYIISMIPSSDPEIIDWEEVLNRGNGSGESELATIAKGVDPEAPAAIMYTSGTTGAPKGVVLDHLGLINKSVVSTERQGITPNDRLCLFFPLFHMFGNTCIALAGLLSGAALIIPCRSLDPEKVLAAIPAEKCTAIYGSPAMLIALIDNPAFAVNDWLRLKKGIIGGAPCPMELMRRIVEEIGVTDITVAYGITETASWVTMTHTDDPIEKRVSTIGTPLSCNEVKIVDPKSGQPLPHETQGELCTRGFLMQEYYKMPAATAAAIDRELWFHTGDLGMMDKEGYVKITGRLKDVIVRNGDDIYPVEIEEVIYLMPEISEVQVFGFPDKDEGQEIAAWIKVKEDQKLDLQALKRHVEAQLPLIKHPKYYKIVSEFPMTSSGKVQKYKLAELAKAEYLKLNFFTPK